MEAQTWISAAVVLVTCIDTLAVDSSIRLSGGYSEKEGFIQVNMSGVWEAICKYSWDELNVLVSCRQLGFTEGFALKWYDYTEGATPGFSQGDSREVIPITRTKFTCDGREESLLSCKISEKYGYCSQYAGVACGVSAAEFSEIQEDIRAGHYSFDYNILTSDDGGGQVLMKERYESGRYGNKILVGGMCNLDERAASLICYNHGYANGGKPAAFPSVDKMLPMLLSELTCRKVYDLYHCTRTYSMNGTCHQSGVQNNGVQCYTSERPIVIGTLSFVCVASLMILIAGVSGICWVHRHSKNPPINTNPVHLEVSANECHTLGQRVPQPSR